jgi:hypothetical protein
MNRRSILKRLLGALVGGSAVTEAKPAPLYRHVFPATNLQRWKPYVSVRSFHVPDWPSALKTIEFKPDKGARV